MEGWTDEQSHHQTCDEAAVQLILVWPQSEVKCNSVWMTSDVPEVGKFYNEVAKQRKKWSWWTGVTQPIFTYFVTQLFYYLWSFLQRSTVWEYGALLPVEHKPQAGLRHWATTSSGAAVDDHRPGFRTEHGQGLTHRLKHTNCACLDVAPLAFRRKNNQNVFLFVFFGVIQSLRQIRLNEVLQEYSRDAALIVMWVQ